LSASQLLTPALQEVSKAQDKELQLEVIAACLSVFTRLDSLL
jgi:Golgi phosphoprotein 3